MSEKWTYSECFQTQFSALLRHVFSLRQHGNAYYAYCSTGQSYVGSFNWELESRSSMISGIEFRGTVNLLLTGTAHLFENVKTKADRELCICKSSLFISSINCPIFSLFNNKLLSTLSCTFFATLRALAGAEWSAKLTKESDTAESKASKRTSIAHADNFGESLYV